MVEDAAPSNPAERERTRLAPKLPFIAAIGKAWLETLNADAEMTEDEHDPRTPAAVSRVVDRAREHKRSPRRRRPALSRQEPPARPARVARERKR